MARPRKTIERHLDEDELDRALEAAQREGDARLLRRLCLVENLYAGDTLADAGTRVGVSQATASRWADAWNEAGVDGLRPSFGGGRPPKLDPAERARLREILREFDGTPSRQDVCRIVEREFDVSYSRRHAYRILERTRREE